MAKVVVAIYVEETEKELLEKAAAIEHRNLSNFLRCVVMKDIKERYGLAIDDSNFQSA